MNQCVCDQTDKMTIALDLIQKSMRIMKLSNEYNSQHKSHFYLIYLKPS